MYFSTQALVPHSGAAYEKTRSASLDRLYGREREIASLIYERGLLTATDVQEALPDKVSNPTIRTALNRLVTKGILTRAKCGSHPAFLYGPALNQISARELELRQLAADFFDGSIEKLAAVMAAIVTKERLSRIGEGA